jgi:hypothetical protein
MASSRNNALEFSSAGSVILKKGTTDTFNTSTFGAIQVLKDCTISSVTATNVDNSSSLHDSFGAGTIIYGNFSAITLGGSSGTVALHKV